MKIFFDTEFTDYDEKQCDDWIKENVLEHLYTRYPKNIKEAPYIPNLHVGNKWEVAKALHIWLKQFDQVELVSDVCHYDMVLLIDLFGRAFDLPDNVSASCYDINQDIARYYGISQAEAFGKSREKILWDRWKDGTVSGKKHNALYDAKVIRELYQILNNIDFDKRT